MRFDAVIFDMDGVLVDSEPTHFATTNGVLASRGVALSQAEYDRCIGMDERAFFALLVECFQLKESADVLAKERVAASLIHLAEHPLPPLPGVLELLHSLQAEGKRLALASSAMRRQINLILDQLGAGRVFAAVVSKDDVELGKPAPDLFVEAARRLGVEPAECLVLEDAALGVQAAVSAGMTAVALVRPGQDDGPHLRAGASLSLPSLSGITSKALEDLIPG
jgi:HAD superfamily hydrolase (TIGR01509 family)